MLNLMVTERLKMGYVDKLATCKYHHEKVMYLLALYESEGARKMLDVLIAHDRVEDDVLALFAGMVRQIVRYEGSAEAVGTLETFEKILLDLTLAKEQRSSDGNDNRQG